MDTLMSRRQLLLSPLALLVAGVGGAALGTPAASHHWPAYKSPLAVPVKFEYMWVEIDHVSVPAPGILNFAPWMENA